MLRLLPMSDRAKDVEILPPPDHDPRAAVERPENQVHPRRPGVARHVAAPTPRTVLHPIRLLVHPETVQRWHRNLIAAHHARFPPNAAPATGHHLTGHPLGRVGLGTAASGPPKYVTAAARITHRFR